jgi:ACR3 family arsenite efflux pump ArsB
VWVLIQLTGETISSAIYIIFVHAIHLHYNIIIIVYATATLHYKVSLSNLAQWPFSSTSTIFRVTVAIAFPFSVAAGVFVHQIHLCSYSYQHE